MFKSALWEILGKFGSQIILFVVSIILARVLSPAEYGTMGMCMVVIGVAGVFMDLGFKNALIQNKEVNQVQYSTVFYVNGFIAFLLFISCFIGARPLAIFFNLPTIEKYFKVLSLSFLFNGLALVPTSILYKNLEFKMLNVSTLIVSVFSGIIGIVMAFHKFGVWSLVLQSVASSFLLMILAFVFASWKPTFDFLLSSIAPLWKYGNRLFLSSIIEAVFSRIDTFVVGRFFSASLLGFYSRALGTDALVRNFSANSILGVVFPYVAKHQNDKVFLKQLYQKYLHIVMFLSVGMSAVLYLISHQLFAVMFTTKWDYAAKLFQIMAIGGFAWPVSALMCNIITGVGNSKAFLRVELYKKALFLPIYICGFLLGLEFFIWLLMAGYYISVIMNAYYVEKETGVALFKQCKIILSYIAIGVPATVVTYFICHFFVGLKNFPSIIINSSIFSLIYILFNFLFKLEGTELLFIVTKKVKLAFQ